MNETSDFDVIIMGGGLAGLISAVLLSRQNLNVCLFEKKAYPFHRVCGEYISNEVIPFLEKHDLFPTDLEPSNIKNFQLTSTNGMAMNMPLDLGAFGVSRYLFDEFLVNKARLAGAQINEKEAITDFTYSNGAFKVNTSKRQDISCKILIGAHGKRSTIDKQLNRQFMETRSPYIGVKYHIELPYPDDLIALHNFKNGYCGISKIENGKYNLCYLSHRENLKNHENIEEMEKAILWKNPYLKNIFNEANFLFPKPEVINEINFDSKPLIENNVLMVGDAAGMITPLCGNGMAMAIHGAKILSESILRNWNKGVPDKSNIESEYESAWMRLFHKRIVVGRNIQKLFGSTLISNMSVILAKTIRPLSRGLMSLTHGEPFS